jgi:ABC-type multidrug transport system fused ATPase/permease subunit
VIRALLAAKHGIKAATIVHSQLLSSVVSTSIAFFDTTPLGRILNRFSKDMQIVDNDLQDIIVQVVIVGFDLLETVSGVAIATKGLILVLLIPLYFVYNNIQGYYRSGSNVKCQVYMCIIHINHIYFTLSTTTTIDVLVQKYQGWKKWQHHRYMLIFLKLCLV